MQKTKETFNKLLWFYLFLNPFLDIISGSYIYAKYSDQLSIFDIDIGLTPSLVVRLAMLLVFAVYIIILKDKKSVIAALPLAAAFALSIVSEYLMLHSINIKADVQYFAKFCYNVAVIFVYGNYFANCGYTKDELLERLYKMMCIVSFVLSAGIIIPYIFDFGFFTYADRFGYRGFRGVYYSGNDITATLMLITPITYCKFLSLSKEKTALKTLVFFGLAPVLSTLCLFLIGTKTAYVAILISLVFTLIYGFSRKKRNKEDKTLKYIMFIAAGVIASMGVLSLLAWQSVFTTIATSIIGIGDAAQESTKTLVLSGRQVLLKKAFEQFRDGGVITWLFGLGRGSQEKVIEMDIFEVIFYYGIFGTVCMLWLYMKIGIGFVVKFFKNMNFATLGVFIALGTCVFYLIIAGHVLFSVTSGFYFAFILIYGTYLLKDASPLEGKNKPI